MAKRLFNDNALPESRGIIPCQKLCLMEMLRDFGELARRRREIEEQVALKLFISEAGKHFAKAGICLRIRKFTAAIEEVFGESFPLLRINRLRSRKLIESFFELGTPAFVCFFPPGKADNPDRFGQLFVDEKLME